MFTQIKTYIHMPSKNEHPADMAAALVALATTDMGSLIRAEIAGKHVHVTPGSDPQRLALEINTIINAPTIPPAKARAADTKKKKATK